MATKKQIEEMGACAVKAALLQCNYLASFISENDKTPSWDGNVFVYTMENQKKENLMGKVPIQVKSTGSRKKADWEKFSCDVVDLRNYYNDGGCVFFRAGVIPRTGECKIYYNSLLVVDIAELLEKAGNQKTITIKCKPFPIDDTNEMAHIFMSFIKDSKKQTSFIGKKILSLEEIQQKGLLKSISFNVTGVGLTPNNIAKFVSTHEFYLYARIKDLDIDIPFDKIDNPTLYTSFDANIGIGDKIFYSSFTRIVDNGQETFGLGKGINFTYNLEEHKGTFLFKPKGTLADLILDLSFWIAAGERQEMTIGGQTIPLSNINDNDIEKCKQTLQYYLDVKKMLDILGVKEELQCDLLTAKDDENIKNFVLSILYNKKISFSNITNDVFWCKAQIANLSILIWVTKEDDGRYKIDNFFNKHEMVLFDSNDNNLSNPIPASHFLLLKRNNLTNISNMNYKAMLEDFYSIEQSAVLIDREIDFLLEIISSYDSQKEKASELLKFAEELCSYICQFKQEDYEEIMLLNRLQIAKRKGPLTFAEKKDLMNLLSKEPPLNIQCGAYLLLDEKDLAQECFDKFNIEQQKLFLTFPISYFGNLKNKE